MEKGVSIRNHKVSFSTLTSGGGPARGGAWLALRGFVCVYLFGLVVRDGGVGMVASSFVKFGLL